MTLRGLSADKGFWEPLGDCLPDRCTGVKSSTAIAADFTSGKLTTMSVGSGERRPILPFFDSNNAEAAISVSGRGSVFGNGRGVPTGEGGRRELESETADTA